MEVVMQLSKQLTEQLSPQQSRSERQLEVLLQISSAIGSIHDSRKLMLAIMQHVTTALGAERSTLFQYDSQTNELWSYVAEGVDENWGEQIRFPADHGIAGRVFQTHQSLCIKDCANDPDFALHFAKELDYMPRSMQVVPLTHLQGRCDGVLQVMHSEPNYFNEHDLVLLEAIAVQVGISLDNARLHEAQKRQFESFVEAFSEALDARDPLTAIHSINVANYSMGIAYELGLDDKEQDWMRIAGLLHDVGKIGVPEAILTKPGKLTDDEYTKMKIHAQMSHNILSKIEFTEEWLELDFIAAAHHERLDGSGYPDGLTAESIPLKARIIAVADVFDALTQDRHYRQGMTTQKAMSIIDEMVPHQLDSSCVVALKRFVNFIDE